MSAPARPRSPWLVVRPRRLPLSARVDRRVPPVLLGLLLATTAAMIVNIGVGEYPITPVDVVRTVLGLETGNPDHHFVVMTLRLPRMLVAALVGLALGTAGAIMQGLTRNPLASPDIIGISAGAGAVAVTLIVLLPSAPAAVLPVAAFGGALITAVLIYLIAWRRGDSPLRLVLVGIGLNAVLGALTTLQITFGNINQVSRALVWLAGSVHGRGWAELQALLPWVLVGLPLALWLARDLNALNLGEEVARGLGSRVAVQRALALVAVVGLAGASVAAAGTIGFVALMAPHIARRLVGPLHEGALPVAALTGATLLVFADLIGRTLLAPIELPAGLVTAAIGAPFFIALLVRGGRT
jgi:iron complex transport system permease protein